MSALIILLAGLPLLIYRSAITQSPGNAVGIGHSGLVMNRQNATLRSAGRRFPGHGWVLKTPSTISRSWI